MNPPDHQSQTPSRVTLWPTSYCVVSQLARWLLALTPEELAQTLCVLPTERLVLNVLSAMTQHRPAFIPPRFVTVETFVEVLAFNAQVFPAVQRGNDLALECLLGDLITQKSYDYLRRGHERELKRIFDAMEETGLGAGALEALVTVIKEDVYRSPEHWDSLLGRALEILDLYLSYGEQLVWMAQKSTGPYRMALRDGILESLGADLPRFPLAAQVIFAGFTTVKPYYVPLWKRLLAYPNVHFWFSQPPVLLNRVNPIGELVISLDAVPRIVPTGESGPSAIRIQRCKNIFMEVAHALDLARSFVNKGVSPSQIGVILASEGDYAGPLRCLLPNFEQPYNLAIAMRFSESSLGIWMTCLWNFLLGGESLPDFFSWLLHPYTRAWWEGLGAFAQSNSLALQETLYAQGKQGKASGNPLENPEPSSLVAQALEIIAVFRSGSEPRDGLTLGQWVGHLREFMDVFFSPERDDTAEDAVTASAFQTWEGFLGQLEEMAPWLPSLYSGREFLTLLKDKLFSQDIRSVGYPLEGIQILSLAESRYVPFQVVILLGCVEGKFPKALPHDELVDDWLKERMGLKGWQYIEALEDTTFQLLIQRVPRVELLYPEVVNDGVTVRSRFLERLVAQGLAEEQGVDSYEVLRRFLTMEGERVRAPSERAGFYPFPSGELLSPMSATALKQLLVCPYQFLLGRLGVKKWELEVDATPQDEGLWIHEVLETFFTGVHQGKAYGEPLPERLRGVENPAGFFEQRLWALTEALLPKAWYLSPLHVHLKAFAWPRLSEFFARFYLPVSPGEWQAQWLASAQEFTLGVASGRPVSVSLSSPDGEGVRVAVQGALDQLLSMNSGYVLLDYKRRAPQEAGYSPQLILYALALEAWQSSSSAEFPMTGGLVGYWAVLEGSWKAQAVGGDVRDWALGHGLVGRSTKDLVEEAQRLTKDWSRRHFALAGAGKTFAPEPGPHCLTCPYHNRVCRVGIDLVQEDESEE